MVVWACNTMRGSSDADDSTMAPPADAPSSVIADTDAAADADADTEDAAADADADFDADAAPDALERAGLLAEWRERWTSALPSGARTKLEPALTVGPGRHCSPRHPSHVNLCVFNYVPSYDVASNTGARANAWCSLIHAEASLSHGGQGESLVPPYTRGSVSLSRGPWLKPGASLYTRKRLSLTGAGAKAWCLLVHAEASPSHGGHG